LVAEGITRHQLTSHHLLLLLLLLLLVSQSWCITSGVLLCALVVDPLWVVWLVVQGLIRATIWLQVVGGVALLAGAVAALPLAVALVPLVTLVKYTNLGEGRITA
jgi:hypothetical protein